MSAYTIRAQNYPSGLPQKIRVGPLAYKVLLTTDPSAEVNGHQVPVFGMVNFKSLVISVDEDLHPAVQWQCLMHELIHIFFEQAGLEDPGEGPDDALAYALFAFLLDNGFLKEENFQAMESS